MVRIQLAAPDKQHKEMTRMKMILLTLGFIALVVNLIAATLKGVTWILDAIQWIGVWCTDWRDEYRKWEG